MIQPTDQPTTTASLRTRKERLLCAMPAHPNIYQPLDPTRPEIRLLLVGTASQMAGWNSRYRQAKAASTRVTEGYREKSPFSPPRILSRSFHPPQPLYAWCSTPPVALIGCGHRPG